MGLYGYSVLLDLATPVLDPSYRLVRHGPADLRLLLAAVGQGRIDPKLDQHAAVRASSSLRGWAQDRFKAVNQVAMRRGALSGMAYSIKVVQPSVVTA